MHYRAASTGETAEELTFLVETGSYTRYVRPEMKEVMKEPMRTGLNFGIISIVVSLTQAPRNFVDYGLESYFTKIILLSEYGKAKPNQGIIHHTAESSGYHKFIFIVSHILIWKTFT